MREQHYIQVQIEFTDGTLHYRRVLFIPEESAVKGKLITIKDETDGKIYEVAHVYPNSRITHQELIDLQNLRKQFHTK